MVPVIEDVILEHTVDEKWLYLSPLNKLYNVGKGKSSDVRHCSALGFLDCLFD